MAKIEHDALTERIIGCAITVNRTLGAGFLEKVYERALCIELRDAGLDACQQTALKVWYKNEIIGDYSADVIVEQKVLLELKSVDRLVEGPSSPASQLSQSHRDKDRSSPQLRSTQARNQENGSLTLPTLGVLSVLSGAVTSL